MLAYKKKLFTNQYFSKFDDNEKKRKILYFIKKATERVVVSGKKDNRLDAARFDS